MKLHRNIYVWYATTFLSYASFTLPIWVIFNTDILGLSNTQAFILGVLPFGLSAFFEIPTGAWADKYGRARMYRLGMFLYILSVASYIFLTNFYVLFALQVLGALGLAMQSGGLEALIHDSLHSKNKDALYARVHANKMTVLFVSRVLTVLVSGTLFAINPRAPFIVATITFSLSLIVSLLYKEVRTETPTALSNFSHVKETIALLRGKQVLLTFLGCAVLYTLCSEALFSFYQPYFKSIHLNVSEFGIFYAVVSALAALGAFWAGGVIKRYSTRSILFAMIFGVLCTFSLLLLQAPALTYLALIPSSVAFGFITTLINTSVQKFIGSRHQATALSVASFSQNFALLVSVIGVGIALDHASVHAVNIGLAVTTLVFCVVLVLYRERDVSAAVTAQK